MNKGDLLKKVLQWDYYDEVFQRRIKLPVFYYDNTSMTAIYTASTDMVRRHLPTPDMHPVEVTPGRALVAFTAFEYRRSDIDPYNEFSISFPITFRKRAIPGLTLLGMMLRRYFTAYVWQLPVTTEIARYGGVEWYGYPKFLADIGFSHEGPMLVCTLSEGGEKILTLKGKKLKTTTEKVNRIKTFSVKNGFVLPANVYVNPIEFAKSMNPNAAQLSIGENHAISRQLREMGLSQKPLFYQYMPLMESVLYAPRNLMDD
ncbi:MAG TPA: acetoacetate decarboxylase family protein [Deltaproteobacteria bacterium]|jgi:hypothetical protein|nr:acetoacetate decarboxylase family protein [Deltaproteobacteria bacterium]HOI07072.1 acetoacetate decarboxylase family protein [Deltaproteobacteria bacterium]